MISNLLSSPANFGSAAKGFIDSIQKISSGSRLTSASVDPAGAAVATELETTASSERMAIRNTNDGMSMLQSIDGAADSQQVKLERMRELAVAASSDTAGASARDAFQAEVDQLVQEFDRTAGSTEFGGLSLTDGSAGTLSVQAGAESSDQIDIEAPDLTAAGVGLGAIDLSTSGGARAAIDAIDAALQDVSSKRADAGAQHNRLTSAAEAGSSRVIDQQAAASRIADTDYAMEIGQQTSKQLQMDSAIAAQTQGRRLDAGMVAKLIGG